MLSKASVSLSVLSLLAVGIGIFQASRPMKGAAAAVSTTPSAVSNTPSYDKDGDLLPPAGYREWVYLTSGIDMSYTANSGMPGHSMFDNVFVNPEAYRSFQETGTWPDKTVMVLEVREAESRGSINLSGHYQGTEIKGLEVHVKDEARFKGEWAFFHFDEPTRNGTLFGQDANCSSCHEAHGAVDTTFVQFYPTLLPIARKKGTLSEAFVKDSAAAVK